jgi:hypothetical protein
MLRRSFGIGRRGSNQRFPSVNSAGSVAFLSGIQAVKGFDYTAPVADFAAASYGLTAARAAAMTASGINTLRIFVKQTDFTNPAGAGLTMNQAVAKWITYIQNVTAYGFKAFISFDSDYTTDRLKSLDGGTGTAAFLTALDAFATGLGSTLPAAQVALELMNEPPLDSEITAAGYQSYSSVYAPMFYQHVRAAAPNLTVIIQSRDLGWPEGITYLNPANFDSNTLFCYHGYDPGPFTHQNDHSHVGLTRLTWPISGYPGGKAAAQALINNNSGLSASDKTARLSDVDFLFFNGGLDNAWMGQQYTALLSWISTNQINPKRIICGEFGVRGDLNYPPYTGQSADLASRCAFMQNVRLIAENNGFGGWVAHQALGDFNIFEQTDVTTHSNRIIPQALEALGLRVPVPAAITNLSVASAASGAVTLTFTAPLDATRYEYRVNGGTATALAANLTATGLASSTTYNIEVRGVNSSSSGPWSNVLSATTTAAVYPGWLSPYMSGGTPPSVAADLTANQYWVSSTDSALAAFLSASRSTARFAPDTAGTFAAFAVDAPAITNAGLSIEAAPWSGANLLTLTKAPTAAVAASTTFPSGLQNFGVVAGYTCAVVDDAAILASSGLAAVTPAGLVYEVVNTTGSTKFLQFQGGTILAQAQVGSWFARKVSGAGTIQLGKSSSGGTNKQAVAIASTYSRYSFTDAGTNAVEVSIPTGVTLRFVVPMLEYKAAAPPSSPVTGASRSADVITLTQAAQAAVNAATTLQVDTGAGLATTTAAALATMLNGSGTTIRKIVAYA